MLNDWAFNLELTHTLVWQSPPKFFLLSPLANANEPWSRLHHIKYCTHEVFTPDCKRPISTFSAPPIHNHTRCSHQANSKCSKFCVGTSEKLTGMTLPKTLANCYRNFQTKHFWYRRCVLPIHPCNNQNCQTAHTKRPPKDYISPGWDNECGDLAEKHHAATTEHEKHDTATALMGHLHTARQERWIETVQAIDFTHSSRKAWSVVRRLTGEKNNRVPSAHQCQQYRPSLCEQWTQRYRSFRNKCGAVFVDLSAAHDTVWHRGLALKMLQLIPNKHMVRFIRELITNRSFKLYFGKDSSKTYTIKNGVPRGSVLVPKLFTIICMTFRKQYQ